MKNLTFSNYNGKIGFRYEQRCKGDGTAILHEDVPASIVEQGDTAIKQYAIERINDLKRRIARADAIEADIEKHHIPIRTVYEGMSLEGRIVRATARGITVELDTPLKGKSDINFGYASAISGHYVFTKEHALSPEGIEAAERALGRAYEKALHAPEQRLVDRLNKS
jgi:hypothetical protein